MIKKITLISTLILTNLIGAWFFCDLVINGQSIYKTLIVFFSIAIDIIYTVKNKDTKI